MNDSRPRAYLLAERRTVFGKNRGALSATRVDDLAAIPLAALREELPALPGLVEDVFLGNTNGAGEDNRNVARMATLLADFPPSVPAATVNRLCGSGGEAVVQATRAIRSGDLRCVIAGGVEGMSRAPFVLPKPDDALPRSQQLEQTTVGWRMVNPRFPSDWTDSLGACVERTASKWGIGRVEQDEWALRSHHLAADAWDKGLMTALPVAGADRDESIRSDASREQLQALRPAFLTDGTLTAGNSSPINDGAGALVLGTAEAARDLGLETDVEVVASVSVGVTPDQFAEAPSLAVGRLLEREGLSAQAIDVWEVNEAFAAVVLGFLHEWPEVSRESVNTDGGAIAIGHPLGASMSRVIVTAADRLRRRGGGLAVVTACIGVGQGQALLLRSTG